MPPEQQAEEQKTGQREDAPKTEGNADTEEAVAALLEEHPELKRHMEAEADRRATKAVKTKEREYQLKMEEAKKRATKDAEEARLLEEGKKDELLALKSAEAREAQEKLEQYEHALKVDRLLDKHEVNDPFIRDLFRKVGATAELKDLDEDVKAFGEKFAEAVGREAERRISTDPPAKNSNNRKADAPASFREYQAEIQRLQTEGKYREAKLLQFQLSDRQARLAGSGSGDAPSYNPFAGLGESRQLPSPQ